MPQSVQLNLPQKSIEFRFDNDDGCDSIAAEVVAHGMALYEVPLPTVLAALCANAGGAYVDVGANTGIYALLAAAANPLLNVHAFEPVPHIADRCARNLALNPHLQPRIRLERKALSNQTGQATFLEHVNSHGHIATSSSMEREGHTSAEYRPIPTEMTTFDEWMQAAKVDRVDLLKVDIEGHEQAFFEGARRTVEAQRPILIVELLGYADVEWFANLQRELDYIDIALRPGEAVKLDRPAFMHDAWNHVFLPSERAWEFARLCSFIGLPIR